MTKQLKKTYFFFTLLFGLHPLAHAMEVATSQPQHFYHMQNVKKHTSCAYQYASEHKQLVTTAAIGLIALNWLIIKKSPRKLPLKLLAYNTAALTSLISGHLCFEKFSTKRKISTFFKAAADGNTEKLTPYTKDSRFNLNIKNQNGKTALMTAASSAQNAAVKTLLDSPYTNPNIQDSDGNTAFMLAAMHNADLKPFLEAQVDVNIQNNDGKTALMLAVEQPFSTRNIFLLLHTPTIDLTLRDNNDNTPLILAVQNNRLENVEELLRNKGIDPNDTNDGLTALMIASQKGFAPIVRVLLEDPRVDKNVQDDTGHTAMNMVLAQQQRQTATASEKISYEACCRLFFQKDIQHMRQAPLKDLCNDFWQNLQNFDRLKMIVAALTEKLHNTEPQSENIYLCWQKHIPSTSGSGSNGVNVIPDPTTPYTIPVELYRQAQTLIANKGGTHSYIAWETILKNFFDALQSEYVIAQHCFDLSPDDFRLLSGVLRGPLCATGPIQSFADKKYEAYLTELNQKINLLPELDNEIPIQNYMSSLDFLFVQQRIVAQKIKDLVNLTRTYHIIQSIIQKSARLRAMTDLNNLDTKISADLGITPSPAAMHLKTSLATEQAKIRIAITTCRELEKYLQEDVVRKFDLYKTFFYSGHTRISELRDELQKSLTDCRTNTQEYFPIELEKQAKNLLTEMSDFITTKQETSMTPAQKALVYFGQPANALDFMLRAQQRDFYENIIKKEYKKRSVQLHPDIKLPKEIMQTKNLDKPTAAALALKIQRATGKTPSAEELIWLRSPEGQELLALKTRVDDDFKKLSNHNNVLDPNYTSTNTLTW